MADSKELDLALLKKLVDGDAVAIRGTATLEPAGGPGEKIFPPSHAVDNPREAGAKYAFEQRRINGGIETVGGDHQVGGDENNRREWKNSQGRGVPRPYRAP